MKILKFIPSKNRAEIFKKHTASWLPFDENTKVFVEPQDVKQYAYINNENMVVLPENDRGLGYSLSQVKKYASENGYDAVWKIDDDIKSFKTRDQKAMEDKEAQLKRTTDTFLEIHKFVSELLEKKPKIGAIGFPYAKELFFDRYREKGFAVNEKLQTSYIVLTKLFDPRPELSTQEDYWAYIHVRMQGYSTIRLGNYGISLGVEVGGGTGGLQDFDRKAMIKGEMEYIRNIYPNIVFKAKPQSKWGYEVDFVKSKLERK